MISGLLFGVVCVLALARAALAARSVKWQCRECGKVLSVSDLVPVPSPTGYGKCPGTQSGAHIWRRLG